MRSAHTVQFWSHHVENRGEREVDKVDDDDHQEWQEPVRIVEELWGEERVICPANIQRKNNEEDCSDNQKPPLVIAEEDRNRADCQTEDDKSRNVDPHFLTRMFRQIPHERGNEENSDQRDGKQECPINFRQEASTENAESG